MEFLSRVCSIFIFRCYYFKCKNKIIKKKFMSLKKSDIAKNITSKISIKNSLSKDIVDSFIEIIKSESNSSDVKISNFGTFMNKVTPERMGRNPKTKEAFLISSRKSISFTPSKKIINKLNNLHE